MTDLNAMGAAARAAARQLATLTTARKNDALRAIADELEARGDNAIVQNEHDIEMCIRDRSDFKPPGNSSYTQPE